MAPGCGEYAMVPAAAGTAYPEGEHPALAAAVVAAPPLAAAIPWPSCDNVDDVPCMGIGMGMGTEAAAPCKCKSAE